MKNRCEERVDDLHRPEQLKPLVRLVATQEKCLGLPVRHDGDHRRDRERRHIAVKVERPEVLGCDFLVFMYCRVADDVAPVAPKDHRGGIRFRKVLVPVGQTLDDPRGLQVHEDRMIVQSSSPMRRQKSLPR